MPECVCGRLRMGQPFDRMKDCPKCWLRAKQGLVASASVALCNDAERVSIQFPHGLGDCVQFTVVLKHLRKYRPNWEIDIACADEPRARLFKNLCRNCYTTRQKPGAEYSKTYNIRFHEHPHLSKVWQCLRFEFNIEPELELFRYELPHTKTQLQNKVILHYRGASSTHKKDLHDEEIIPVIEWLERAGVEPVILDWYNKGVYRIAPPADELATLFESARAWVGIDSGPGHVGGAVDAPGVVVWTGHHPSRFYDPAPNVTHLVPADIAGKQFLNCHYRYYDYGNREAIPGRIIEFLRGNMRGYLAHNMLISKVYDETYYQQHKDAGLDYAVFGDWQAEYGKWLLNCLTSVAPVEQSPKVSDAQDRKL